MQLELTGNLYVIAAPSGAGKTSLVQALTTDVEHLNVAVSHTTRPRRPHEQDGKNYHFISEAQFLQMIDANEFVEHASVFGNYYGTSWQAITTVPAGGRDLILEIDWQGARQVRKSMPDCVTIFVLPPSLGELERRLRDRRTDSEAVIERRLRDAVSDMGRWEEFDYVIVNDGLDQAVADLEAVFAGQGDAQAVENDDLRTRIVDIIGL